MKKIKTIVMAVSLSCLSAIAQNQTGINPPEKNLEMLKLNGLSRPNAFEQPFTSQEVQIFVDYINDNPIVMEIRMDENLFYEKMDMYEKLSYRKIELAQRFYDYTKDQADKRKLVDLLIKTFPDIQAARDKLGINPMSESEGWLDMVPKPLPGEKTQDWTKRITEQTNKRINSIETLESIHRHIYRTLTEDMKINLEGVPKVLERSPEEKARTKEFLEKYAAENGQKKFKLKVPGNQAK